MKGIEEMPVSPNTVDTVIIYYVLPLSPSHLARGSFLLNDGRKLPFSLGFWDGKRYGLPGLRPIDPASLLAMLFWPDFRAAVWRFYTSYGM